MSRKFLISALLLLPFSGGCERKRPEKFFCYSWRHGGLVVRLMGEKFQMWTPAHFPKGWNTVPASPIEGKYSISGASVVLQLPDFFTRKGLSWTYESDGCEDFLVRHVYSPFSKTWWKTKLARFEPAHRDQPYWSCPHWVGPPDDPVPGKRRKPEGPSAIVYYDAKRYLEVVETLRLPKQHASNFAVFFLRWLIERDLVSSSFKKERSILEQFRTGKASIHDVFERWNNCLTEEMLSDQGNAFALYYLDDRAYEKDYARVLQARLLLPSLSQIHVEYSEKNYQRLSTVIDRRFEEWKNPKKQCWPL